MAAYNRVILVGNLTRDIELRHVSTGTAVTDVGLAVNDRVKRNDLWVDETTFVDITMWGRTAEIAAEYLSKGSPVLIEGRLKLERWEKDGQNRSKLKVICDKMQLLREREASGQSAKPNNAGPSRQQTQRAQQAADQRGEDLPF